MILNFQTSLHSRAPSVLRTRYQYHPAFRTSAFDIQSSCQASLWLVPKRVIFRLILPYFGLAFLPK